MKKTFKIFLGIIVIGISVTSCKKENPDFTSSENNSLADAAFIHIENVVDAEVKFAEDENAAQKTNGIQSANHDTCASVTWSLSNDLSYIDSVTIDYGEGGCTWQGRTKTGKILVTMDGKGSEEGTNTKVELIDFTIDGYKVEGIKQIETTSVTRLLGFPINWTEHVTVSNGKITSPNGNEKFTWTSDRIHKAGLIDNEIILLIDGTINGVNTKGESFTITTNSNNPIKFVWGCPRVVSGILNITPAGKSTRTIDYGDGTCDYKATVTINKKDYEIILW